MYGPLLLAAHSPEGFPTGTLHWGNVNVGGVDGIGATRSWTPLQVRVIQDKAVGDEVLVLRPDVGVLQQLTGWG